METFKFTLKQLNMHISTQVQVSEQMGEKCSDAGRLNAPLSTVSCRPQPSMQFESTIFLVSPSHGNYKAYLDTGQNTLSFPHALLSVVDISGHSQANSESIIPLQPWSQSCWPHGKAHCPFLILGETAPTTFIVCEH